MPTTLLAGLHCLRVTGIQGDSHMWHLGRLLGACTQLCKLQLVFDEVAASAAAPPAEGAAAAPSAAALASGMAATGCLPPLQHLEVSGADSGLPDLWLSQPEAAAQFTALLLHDGCSMEAGLGALAACSGLRELVLERADEAPPLLLPDSLHQLTALTRLVLHNGGFYEVPPVVWSFTQLRQLGITHTGGWYLPQASSSLQQLEELDISMSFRSLPAAVGTWLPNLQSLDAAFAGARPPRSLAHNLTRLHSYHCCLRDAECLSHLVGLKELCIEESVLSNAFLLAEGLSALDTLTLGGIEDNSVDYL
jgi:hypothetical protein